MGSWKEETKSLLIAIAQRWHIGDFQETCVSQIKRQPHKMVKHAQKIRRLLPTNCLSVFDHFVGLALKGLIKYGPWDTASNQQERDFPCWIFTYQQLFSKYF